VLVALLLVTGSHGAKILGVFALPSTSHNTVPRVLMLELASRGHQVTEITPIPESKVVPNYTQIAVAADIIAATGGNRKRKRT
jgi:glucuronosyltransferase